VDLKFEGYFFLCLYSYYSNIPTAQAQIADSSVQMQKEVKLFRFSFKHSVNRMCKYYEKNTNIIMVVQSLIAPPVNFYGKYVNADEM